MYIHWEAGPRDGAPPPAPAAARRRASEGGVPGGAGGPARQDLRGCRKGCLLRMCAKYVTEIILYIICEEGERERESYRSIH